MAIIKSFSVGNGDMFYIEHNNGTLTMIDCDLNEQNANAIIGELRRVAKDKAITRFICTHPDDDHFGGIELLDRALPISNFYAVKNQAVKDIDTVSFLKYRDLRDGPKAFYIEKGVQRKWLNEKDGQRNGAGISILWPDVKNDHFRQALALCDAGASCNNTSAVIRYHVEGALSFLWLGDLETEFMEGIANSIALEKTTVVFAAHHGRKSGKIPDSWLEKLDPQIIVIGEAPSRHLHYYTGYETITQNSAGDITMVCGAWGGKLHFYTSNRYVGPSTLRNEGQAQFPGYIGTLTVESEYTL